MESEDDAPIQVTYSPRSIEQDGNGDVIPDEDVLLIRSNDLDEPLVEVELYGFVTGNLPPVTGIWIVQTTKLGGELLDDFCARAPTDTIRFEARVIDPEGGQIQPSNLVWELFKEDDHGGMNSLIPTPESFQATFKVDVWGDYKACVTARDPQGNKGTHNLENTCDCRTANAAEDYSCRCVEFTAVPREDIRIELEWDITGPDLDLHLVAPDGQFCTPTLDCGFDPIRPDNPDWTRTACDDTGDLKTCRTPNCPPEGEADLDCLSCQECRDGACHFKKCSGSDCYWDGRHPDWEALCDESDDPAIPIDCTDGCREEKLYLNKPRPGGNYQVRVNYYRPFTGMTNATVRIFFKGDVEPSAEIYGKLTAECDTWTVALIECHNPGDYDVIDLGDEVHTSLCCE